MAGNLNPKDYEKLEAYSSEDIYVHKKKNGKPKFVAVTARGPAMESMIEDKVPYRHFRVTATDDRSLIDLKIQVDEFLMGTYGPPHPTSLGMGWVVIHLRKLTVESGLASLRKEIMLSSFHGIPPALSWMVNMYGLTG